MVLLSSTAQHSSGPGIGRATAEMVAAKIGRRQLERRVLHTHFKERPETVLDLLVGA